MKKFRFLSWLLCLSLLFATLTVPSTAAVAEETSDDDKSGMVFTKKAEKTGDKEYTITLEAYATGSKVISEVTKDVPTDIILVLDQSGSMSENFNTVTTDNFNKYIDTTNNELYSKRSSLYYKIAENAYASVNVSVEEGKRYSQLGSLVNNDTSWLGNSTDAGYWYYVTNGGLFEKVGEEYKSVTLTRTRNYGTYTYTFSDGTKVTSTRNSGTPDLGNHGPLYTEVNDETKNIYTYTYNDINGAQQTITSIGATTVLNDEFYNKTTTSSTITKLEALKSAVISFANVVTEKAKGNDGQFGTADDVNHRIAVVGYATDASDLTNGFKDMNDADQVNAVNSAINGLKANGGTHINAGISVANGIFQNNPVAYNEDRNRVMIVFTDGGPGLYGDWGSESVETANSAIFNAKVTKNTHKATVYTVGIFLAQMHRRHAISLIILHTRLTIGVMMSHRMMLTRSKILIGLCIWFLQTIRMPIVLRNQGKLSLI